ncbi:hypothetical protein OQA88_12197 [Cercophora sp. LCS_1]
MPSVDSLLFNISSFLAGLFLLEYGADKFIDHTAIVAKRLNVSPTLVGLLTCGAEWEELVVIAVALSQKNSNLALGNLIGSSIANILASFSLGLLFMDKVQFDRSSKIYTAVLLASTSAFLVLLTTITPGFRLVAGALLITAFVVYVGSVATFIYRGTLTAPENSDSDSDGSSSSDSSSDSSDSESEPESSAPSTSEPSPRRWSSEKGYPLSPLNNPKPKRQSSKPKVINKRPKPLRYHLFRLTLGLAALLVSSYIIAHSASTIGNELQLSGTVVGTTILSLATTLPEKFVAILGGVRKQPGIMVANTVGSNIFLVTLCGGVLFIWGDAEALRGAVTVFELGVMWFSAVVILGVVLVGGRRWVGGVLVVAYVGFLVLEILGGREVDD